MLDGRGRQHILDPIDSLGKRQSLNLARASQIVIDVHKQPCRCRYLSYMDSSFEVIIILSHSNQTSLIPVLTSSNQLKAPPYATNA